MSELDTPALGRKIKYLIHHDRSALLDILNGTLPSCWPDLARTYLSALGADEATDQQAAVPGVISLWVALLKEHNAQPHHRTDRGGESRQTAFE